MSAFNFETLMWHKGHNVEVVTYSSPADPDDIWNVAIECTDCNVVLLDYNNPENEE